MFIGFFYKLKEARVPVSLREYLTLRESVEKCLSNYAVEDLYFLDREAVV